MALFDTFVDFQVVSHTRVLAAKNATPGNPATRPEVAPVGDSTIVDELAANKRHVESMLTFDCSTEIFEHGTPAPVTVWALDCCYGVINKLYDTPQANPVVDLVMATPQGRMSDSGAGGPFDKNVVPLYFVNGIGKAASTGQDVYVQEFPPTTQTHVTVKMVPHAPAPPECFVPADVTDCKVFKFHPIGSPPVMPHVGGIVDDIKNACQLKGSMLKIREWMRLGNNLIDFERNISGVPVVNINVGQTAQLYVLAVKNGVPNLFFNGAQITVQATGPEIQVVEPQPLYFVHGLACFMINAVSPGSPDLQIIDSGGLGVPLGAPLPVIVTT